MRGATLGTIVVQQQDGSGHTMPVSGNVDFSVSACGGTLDLGSASLSNGVATLDSAQRLYTLAGGLTVTASSGALNAGSASFAVMSNPDFVFADGYETCRP